MIDNLPYTEIQRLLLNVILAEPAQALADWERWQALTDWTHQSIDQGSYRLLPLVYRRLAVLTPADSSIALLKGLYRRAWIENTRLVQLGLPTLKALSSAGYPLLLLKGVSLSVRYYRDRGVRTISDIDFVVPEERAFQALDLLESLGWYSDDTVRSGHEFLARFHAVNLYHPSGGAIDLHRYVMPQNLTPAIDAPVWKRAVSIEVEGLPVLALGPEDELLHTCLHGLQWNVVAPIRWIVDAGTILAAEGPGFDWDYFVSETRRRETSRLAALGLSILGEGFGLAVPPSVLQSLKAVPFAWFEAAEVRQLTTNPGWIPDTLHKRLFTYYRNSGRPAGAGWWLGLLKYLFFFVKPPALREIPGWAYRRIHAKSRQVAELKREVKTSIPTDPK